MSALADILSGVGTKYPKSVGEEFPREMNHGLKLQKSRKVENKQ